MRIKLLKSVIVNGCSGALRGDVIEAPEGVAGQLVATGAAVEVRAEKLKAEALKPETVQTREPAAETRDPTVPRGKRRA